MITELWPLLQRVEASGGPVEVGNRLDVSLVFVRLDRREEVPLWEEDFGEYSNRKSENEALLIHALRLDARERGIFVQEVTDRRADGGGYDVQFEPLVWGASGRHENEVCAWLLAWLDAFEDTK